MAALGAVACGRMPRERPDAASAAVDLKDIAERSLKSLPASPTHGRAVRYAG